MADPLYTLGKPRGLMAPGNLDLNGRKVYHGSWMPFNDYRTENSMSGEVDGMEVLIPTVVGGQQLGEDAAWQHYFKTGENLGQFSNPADAEAYAQRLHERQAEVYRRKILAQLLSGKP